MEASTVFEADNKLISLDNKNCTTSRDKKKVTCTTVTSCLKYNGINLPTSIDIEISWVLDSKKSKTPRMFFTNDEGKNIRNSTMRLYRGKPECRTEAVYIADGIRDKLTPLEVEMKYNIRQATSSYTTSTVSRRRRAALEPVLDENRGTVQRDSVNIMKNCGKDNICIPDLKLDVRTDDKYLLGANESLTVEVLISNSGEDAFEANFFMNIPQGLDFKSTKRIGESRDTSYICTAPSVATNNTLKCDIGNPLPAGKSVNFKVFLEPTKRGGKASIVPFYDFYMEANSTNEEAEGGRFDNAIKKSVAIFVESDLAITGSSMPSELHYNVSQYKEFKNATHEAEIGPHVVHIYDIRNNGTSTIEEIEIFINWPAETLDDQPLMYLMNQPETSGNVVCDQTQFVNQVGLERDRVLERKSFLDKNRSPNRQGEFGFSSGFNRNRYNNQGGATNEERRILDRDDSHESTGDASFDHEQRGKDSSYYESWRSQSGSGGSSSNRQGSGGSTNRNSFTETRHQAGSSGDERLVGSQNFDWKASQGGGSRGGGMRESSTVYQSGSSSNSQGSGSRGSQFESSQSSSAGGRRENANFDRNFGSDSNSAGGRFESTNFEKNYESNRNSAGSSQGQLGGAIGGGNVREYEVHETWNSTSVNGGPAVVHHASKNKTTLRGQDGKVAVSEVSTERTYTGGVIGGRWDDRESSSQSGSRYYEDSSRTSQSQSDYEKQQQEHYESQRRYQEEQRQLQIEDRRRQQEAQRRQEEERIRVEEEKRRIDDERKRIQHESTYTTRTQSGSGSGYESSNNRQSESRTNSMSSGGSR